MKKTFTILDFDVIKFNSYIKRLKWNVPGVSVSFGKVYSKFITDKIIVEGVEYNNKYFADVVDVDVTIPDVNGWELIAYFKNGVFFEVAESSKLEFYNNHGSNHAVCDSCGCSLSGNSYIIRNVKTNKELQLDYSCIKKYKAAGIYALCYFLVKVKTLVIN